MGVITQNTSLPNRTPEAGPFGYCLDLLILVGLSKAGYATLLAIQLALKHSCHRKKPLSIYFLKERMGGGDTNSGV